MLHVVRKPGSFFCPRLHAWIDFEGMTESEKLFSELMLRNGDQILLPLPFKVLKVHLQCTGSIHTMRFDSRLTVKELIEVVIEKAQLNASLPFVVSTKDGLLHEDFYIVELPETCEGIMLGYSGAIETD